VAGAREVAEVARQMNDMFGVLAAHERSLVETQDRLNGVLGSMDRALWSFAPDMSAMLFASASTEKIFGRPADEFLARPRLWLEMAHPEERAQAEAVLDRLALSGDALLEYRIVLPGGGIRWVEIRWRHVSDALGNRARLDGIVADVTERKQAEEENRQLLAIVEQSLNEIYVFDAVTLRYEYANGGALHNLGYSFRHLKLLTPLDLMPQYSEGSFVRLGDLIDDLLTFSRVGRTELNRMQVDMEAMARTVVEELRPSYPHAQISIQPMPGAQADPALLRQVMLNLVSNALKFSSRRADAHIAIGVLQEGEPPAYFVRDNGAGFDTQHAAKLFGVFQRLHQESDFPGTGVGLAIVRRIIERHKGRVWAESSPGKGATFFFTLP
jgi:PAS domain S-box-containing protein